MRYSYLAVALAAALGTTAAFDAAAAENAELAALKAQLAELQAKVVPEVLDGKKFICLAISEAFAGSDVGGLQTYAERDGDEWVITGTKKWITNGVFADYFTVAARTDVSARSVYVLGGERVVDWSRRVCRKATS